MKKEERKGGEEEEKKKQRKKGSKRLPLTNNRSQPITTEVTHPSRIVERAKSSFLPRLWDATIAASHPDSLNFVFAGWLFLFLLFLPIVFFFFFDGW